MVHRILLWVCIAPFTSLTSRLLLGLCTIFIITHNDMVINSLFPPGWTPSRWCAGNDVSVLKFQKKFTLQKAFSERLWPLAVDVAACHTFQGVSQQSFTTANRISGADMTICILEAERTQVQRGYKRDLQVTEWSESPQRNTAWNEPWNKGQLTKQKDSGRCSKALLLVIIISWGQCSIKVFGKKTLSSASRRQLAFQFSVLREVLGESGSQLIQNPRVEKQLGQGLLAR